MYRLWTVLRETEGVTKALLPSPEKIKKGEKNSNSLLTGELERNEAESRIGSGLWANFVPEMGKLFTVR